MEYIAECGGKIKNMFFLELETRFDSGVTDLPLIFMLLTAERDNLMQLCSWRMPYTWRPHREELYS